MLAPSPKHGLLAFLASSALPQAHPHLRPDVVVLCGHLLLPRLYNATGSVSHAARISCQAQHCLLITPYVPQANPHL